MKKKVNVDENMSDDTAASKVRQNRKVKNVSDVILDVSFDNIEKQALIEDTHADENLVDDLYEIDESDNKVDSDKDGLDNSAIDDLYEIDESDDEEETDKDELDYDELYFDDEQDASTIQNLSDYESMEEIESKHKKRNKKIFGQQSHLIIFVSVVGILALLGVAYYLLSNKSTDITLGSTISTAKLLNMPQYTSTAHDDMNAVISAMADDAADSIVDSIGSALVN